jgi:hypothetical protein
VGCCTTSAVAPILRTLLPNSGLGHRLPIATMVTLTARSIEPERLLTARPTKGSRDVRRSELGPQGPKGPSGSQLRNRQRHACITITLLMVIAVTSGGTAVRKYATAPVSELVGCLHCYGYVHLWIFLNEYEAHEDLRGSKREQS